MLEFKLNMYFLEYRDIPCMSLTKFRGEFIKKEGNFPLINELFIMIQKYQYAKYGELLSSGRSISVRHKKNTYNNRSNGRDLTRFGTKEERRKRKLEELHK